MSEAAANDQMNTSSVNGPGPDCWCIWRIHYGGGMRRVEASPGCPTHDPAEVSGE